MAKKVVPNTKHLVEYYDLLADDYNSRWVNFVDNQYKVVKPFADKVHSQFGKGARIVDLGCGVGLNSYILTEMFEHNFDVNCIDASQEMIKCAKDNCPKAKHYATNFLDWEPEQKYHGLVAGSFLNQFDASMAPYVVEKMGDLLEDKGYGLVYASDTPDYDDNKKIEAKKQKGVYVQMIDRLNMSNLLSQFFDIEEYYKGYGKRGWTITIIRKS